MSEVRHGCYSLKYFCIQTVERVKDSSILKKINQNFRDVKIKRKYFQKELLKEISKTGGPGTVA